MSLIQQGSFIVVERTSTSSTKSSPFYEFRRWVALRLIAFAGWTVEGKPPSTRKAVVIAAPHTSNWDLPFMLAVGYHFRVKLKWMGKDDLFKGPFGWLMKAMGGIPIDLSLIHI